MLKKRVALLFLALSSLPSALAASTPRIIVLIPEAILRRPTPDPAAETEIQRALIAAGYKVIDLERANANKLRDVFRNEPNNAQAYRELATRYPADLLITGEAFAEEYGNVLSQRGYTARLEMKVVDLASAQMVFSDAFTGTGMAATDSVAGKTALQNVGKLAGAKLPGLLNNWASGQNVRTGQLQGRSYTVKVTGVPSLKALNDLLRRLGAQKGVGEASQSQFDSAGAVLDVSYQGSAEALGGLLEDLGLHISSLSGGEISARF